MAPIVQFQNVTRRFGNTLALDNVSFEIEPGTVFALLGANGAGKTTAIRLMLGLDSPDSGTVNVMGLDSAKKPLEIRSQVGYVADRPPLYEWMTVDEIGWFTSGFYPSGFQAKYDALRARFDVDGSKAIRELSKGMRAKVALALSMAHEPPLLVLDEPTSGLDPLVRREFLESMVDVASAGRTVFLSSHQVNEVERVADVVAILLNGKLVCIERLEDLKRNTTEVVLTLPNVEAKPPQMPGQVLAHVPFGHDLVWMVRNLDAAQLQNVCRDSNLPSPLIRQPNLEDILLAMLREYRLPSRPQEVVTTN
ncbi:MAG: ABC transporter ATP-binding protein [Planctomycetaceae bacterium]|nr:ABC transporter ATP-binding protein [Planctomycetaceae bacterium]